MGVEWRGLCGCVKASQTLGFRVQAFGVWWLGSPVVPFSVVFCSSFPSKVTNPKKGALVSKVARVSLRIVGDAQREVELASGLVICLAAHVGSVTSE